MVRGLARKCARRHSRLDADDLAQEGFLALLWCSHTFDPGLGVSFGAYARRRVHGAMQDAVRRRMTEDGWSRSGAREMPTWRTLDAGEAQEVASPPDQHDFDLETVRMVLVRILGQRDAEVVELRVLAGWTLQEVGLKIGVTRERVRQIEARAMVKLRWRLSAWAPGPRAA